MKPHHFLFFFQFWGFFRKTEKKKTQFSFSNCKNSQFYASKKKFFSDFTLGNRHLLNSRETVSSFTAVSLKLTWNSKNGQSFTETGCQKYGVFGMKSADSTVSLKQSRKKKSSFPLKHEYLNSKSVLKSVTGSAVKSYEYFIFLEIYWFHTTHLFRKWLQKLNWRGMRLSPSESPYIF